MMASSAEPAAPRRRRITADEKRRLRAFFASANWALNTHLPRAGVYRYSQIGKIAAEMGLTRDQVSTQLRNYKEEKYGNSPI